MLRSPISILHELATKRSIGTPLWEISGAGKDHTKTFECICKFNSQVATGTGPSKKEAKNSAAINMLKVCGIETDKNEEMEKIDAYSNTKIPNICLTHSKTKTVISLNHVGKLNEFCVLKNCRYPVYKEATIIADIRFCFVCQFQEFTTTGYGITKKGAKQDAAWNMLLLLKESATGAGVIVEIPVEQSCLFK